MTDRLITVCSDCLRTSCWHGEFMCDNATAAGIIELTELELTGLHREHPWHYSVTHVREVCGD